MPKRDEHGRLGGFLEIEEYTDAWRRRFVLLDESTLKLFKGKDTMQDSMEDEPIHTIDLVYITKVAITTTKPKVEYCFEIHTASQKWYLRSNTDSEIEDWFKALHKAAVNPKRDGDNKATHNIGKNSGSIKSTGSTESEDLDSDLVYETKIIGGVPVRTVKAGAADSSSLPLNRSNSYLETIKPVKEGYCVKQGAVMKNWKRRYFKLDLFKFCYYEKETDKDPIRSLPATTIKRSGPCVGSLGNKQHVFEVETFQRTYYIQADSEEEMQDWIKAVKHVIRSIKGKSTLDSNCVNNK